MGTFVRAVDVTCEGVDARINFEVLPGEIAVVITPKDEINALLTRLLIGIQAPPTGSVTLFDSNLAGKSSREILDIRRRLGVVYSTGGLVSNLKVWENLTLPLYFHTASSAEEIEARGLAVLKRLGYSGRLMELPGLLSVYQKKLIGFGRAMLCAPELLIYESPLQGLNRDEREHFVNIAREFHYEQTDRASLFITSTPDPAEYLPNARIIALANGRKS